MPFCLLLQRVTPLGPVRLGPSQHPTGSLREETEQNGGNLLVVSVESTSIKIQSIDELIGKYCSLPKDVLGRAGLSRKMCE